MASSIITPEELGRDNQNWLQMWNDSQTEFHQLQVSPLLQRCWEKLPARKGRRVLVPLCGKSLDMIWLAQQGCEVVGVELSPVAARAFFKEAGLKARKQRIGNFVRWHSGAITIWCGDLFALQPGQLGQIDRVFDRAALTALPPDLRPRYVAQIGELVSAAADMLMLTLEDLEPGEITSDPVPAIDPELQRLYSERFGLQLLDDIPPVITPENDPSGSPLRGGQELPGGHHKAYHLTPLAGPRP